MTTSQEAAETPFEKSFERLQSVVRKLEAGETGLEEGLKLFEEGTALARVCREALDVAERRVEQLLKVKEDGTLETAPFGGKP